MSPSSNTVFFKHVLFQVQEHYYKLFLLFYVHVTVHCNEFLYNRTNQMHQFPKFTPAWNSTVPSRSSSKAVFKPVWHTPVRSLQWINSWWWTEEQPETCRVSRRSKFGKLVHLVGFIIEIFLL